MASIAAAISSSVVPVATIDIAATSRSSGSRPAARAPSCRWGTRASRRYRADTSGWQISPSPTAPATSTMRRPTPATHTRGGPWGLVGGTNVGGIRVCV